MIKKLLKKINAEQTFDIDKFGVIRERVNEKIHIYDSKIASISTIICYFQNGTIAKISFGGEELNYPLQSLIEIFGDYEKFYNPRDNFTLFSFNLLGKSNALSKISAKKDDNVVTNSKDFLIKNPFGSTERVSSELLMFNNFTLHY